ncbi:hypothetical protein P9112_000271 [Eukaryota sp. TZLM1-RC]
MSERPLYNRSCLIGNWFEERATAPTPKPLNISSSSSHFKTIYQDTISCNKEPSSEGSQICDNQFITTTRLHFQPPSPSKVASAPCNLSSNQLESYRNQFTKCPTKCLHRFQSETHRSFAAFK